MLNDRRHYPLTYADIILAALAFLIFVVSLRAFGIL